MNTPKQEADLIKGLDDIWKVLDTSDPKQVDELRRKEAKIYLEFALIQQQRRLIQRLEKEKRTQVIRLDTPDSTGAGSPNDWTYNDELYNKALDKTISIIKEEDGTHS